jgi:hypothetical protein
LTLGSSPSSHGTERPLRDGALDSVSAVVFSVAQRDGARIRLIELARGDPRIVSAAVVGSEATGRVDRWSDIDLTFAVRDDDSVEVVLTDWTHAVESELGGVVLFDVRVESSIYRVFLLPGSLQVDLSFTPASRFGATGPRFALLFGEATARPWAEPVPSADLFGLAVHHAVRGRLCIERERWWQAEYWISGVRDQALTLACKRRGLEEAHGRGLDRLPAEVLDAASLALVRTMERAELLRALGACVNLLLAESDEVAETAERVAPELRALMAAQLDEPGRY